MSRRSSARRDRRRHLIKSSSPQHLYIVAGLPAATLRVALAWFEGQKNALAKGAPAASNDGQLYPQNLIERLLHSAGEFAIRRRIRGSERPPAPATITLLYVPSSDSERLLSTFDFAVMAVPLTSLISRDESARQRRHDVQAVTDALAEAVEASGSARQNLYAVVERLNRRSDHEALLLPPRNFMTGDHDLAQVFRALRAGERAWNDRFGELGPSVLTHDDIARIPPKATRRVFVDSRGMAFLAAHPSAYHAVEREVQEAWDVDALLNVLRSLYRFGGALPHGFHHDAQRCDGTELDGATFNCGRDGRVSTQGTHANIYPNDFVRARHKARAT